MRSVRSPRIARGFTPVKHNQKMFCMFSQKPHRSTAAELSFFDKFFSTKKSCRVILGSAFSPTNIRLSVAPENLSRAFSKNPRTLCAPIKIIVNDPEAKYTSGLTYYKTSSFTSCKVK